MCGAIAGINYLLNATYFNQSKTGGFRNALSNITGVPACWINITDVTAYNLNPNGSLGSPASRRLLQAPTPLTLDLGLYETGPGPRRRLVQAGTGAGAATGAALGIGSFLPSTNGNGVLNSLNNAYDNGQLADSILPDPLQLELLKITPSGVSNHHVTFEHWCLVFVTRTQLCVIVLHLLPCSVALRVRNAFLPHGILVECVRNQTLGP